MRPRRRSNPLGVPLDAYTRRLEPAPYPYPFEDAALDAAEKARRWEAIKATDTRNYQGQWARDQAARAEYEELFGGVLADLAARLAELARGGGLDPAGATWPDALLTAVGRGTRDVLAALFAREVHDHRLFVPGQRVAHGGTGPRAPRLDAAALQARYEARAALYERWAADLAAAAAGRERRAYRAVYGRDAAAVAAPVAAEFRALESAVTRAQGTHAADPTRLSINSLGDVREGLGKLAAAAGYREFGAAVELLFRLPEPELARAVARSRRAQAAAARGAGRAGTRREEARLGSRDRDEPGFPDEWVVPADEVGFPALWRVVVKPGTRADHLVGRLGGRVELRGFAPARSRLYDEVERQRLGAPAWQGRPYFRLPLAFHPNGRTSDWTYERLASTHRDRALVAAVARALYMGAVQRAGVPLDRMFAPEVVAATAAEARALGVPVGEPLSQIRGEQEAAAAEAAAGQPLPNPGTPLPPVPPGVVERTYQDWTGVAETRKRYSVLWWTPTYAWILSATPVGEDGRPELVFEHGAADRSATPDDFWWAARDATAWQRWRGVDPLLAPAGAPLLAPAELRALGFGPYATLERMAARLRRAWGPTARRDRRERALRAAAFRPSMHPGRHL